MANMTPQPQRYKVEAFPDPTFDLSEESCSRSDGGHQIMSRRDSVLSETIIDKFTGDDPQESNFKRYLMLSICLALWLPILAPIGVCYAIYLIVQYHRDIARRIGCRAWCNLCLRCWPREEAIVTFRGTGIGLVFDEWYTRVDRVQRGLQAMKAGVRVGWRPIRIAMEPSENDPGYASDHGEVVKPFGRRVYNIARETKKPFRIVFSTPVWVEDDHFTEKDYVTSDHPNPVTDTMDFSKLRSTGGVRGPGGEITAGHPVSTYLPERAGAYNKARQSVSEDETNVDQNAAEEAWRSLAGVGLPEPDMAGQPRRHRRVESGAVQLTGRAQADGPPSPHGARFYFGQKDMPVKRRRSSHSIQVLEEAKGRADTGHSRDPSLVNYGKLASPSVPGQGWLSRGQNLDMPDPKSRHRRMNRDE